MVRVKRVEVLTDEHRSHFDEWRDKWIAIGLSTERADRATFESAVVECYQFAKLAPPKRIVWVDSPLTMAIAAPIANAILAGRLGGQFGGVRGELGRATSTPIHGDIVGQAVGGAVASVAGAINDVAGNVGAHLGSAVGGGGELGSVEKLLMENLASKTSPISVAVRTALGDAARSSVGINVGWGAEKATRMAYGRHLTDAVEEDIPQGVRDALTPNNVLPDEISGRAATAAADMIDSTTVDVAELGVTGAVSGAVTGAVTGAVDGAVRDAVGGEVGVAVDDAVGGVVTVALVDHVNRVAGRHVDESIARGVAAEALEGSVAVEVGSHVRGSVDDAVTRSIGDDARRDVRDRARFVGKAAAQPLLETVVASVAATGDLIFRAGDRDDRALPGFDIDVAVREVRDNWSQFIGGQFWVGGWYWGSPSFVSFFREICGLELPGDIDARAIAYEKTTRSACWWWPHREFVIVCERPTMIERDSQGRLHAEHGPAMAFPGGWGFASWHGVRVPREWIENRATLDPKIALTWPNIEQRRAAAEMIGWDRVLTGMDMHIIDADPDPEIGTLFRSDLPDAPASLFLRVRCPTARDFVVPIPSDGKLLTARAANAWTYGLEADEYKPEVRT